MNGKKRPARRDKTKPAASPKRASKAPPPLTKRSVDVAPRAASGTSGVDQRRVKAERPADAPTKEQALATAKAFMAGAANKAPRRRGTHGAPPPARAAEAPVARTPAPRPETPPPPPLEVAADPEPDEPPIEEPEPETAEVATRRVDVPHARESGDLADEIRALEERLDKMIDEASRRQLPTADVPPTPPPPTYPPPPSTRAVDPETVFDTARELLSTDFYLRKWGRMGMRNRSEEVDDFGFDPIYEQKVRPFFDFLYDKYFRVETEGIEKIPPNGRCLLVANHSGTIPFDGVMLKTAVKREHPTQRDVRWLAEDFIFHFPFLGAFSNRVGAVRACQENAARLLNQEALVAVFPEGVKGIGKLYAERYKLQRFGRGGFIKLCLRTGTPIVPVAVVGAEETNPMLARVEYFSKALGLPYVPLTPTFPLLGPAGLLPAPTKWRILFGDPIDLDAHGAESADDEILVGRLSERVRATIQAMLDRAVGARRSVWFG